MSNKIVIEGLNDKIYSKLLIEANLKKEDLSTLVKKLLKEFEKDTMRTSEIINKLKGTWSKEYYEEFSENTEHFSKIDKEMWENLCISNFNPL